MKGSKLLGIIMLVAGLYLGYIGINKISNNTNNIKVLGMEIDASNENGQTKGILFLVGAAILVVGGARMMGTKAMS